MDEAHARAVLARAPGLTAEALAALSAASGGDLALAASPRALVRVELPPATRSFLAAPSERRIAADLDWLAQSRAAILLSTDAAYPPLLKATVGAPAALYVQGPVELLATRQLAMVGSRSPTPAGRSTAREFAAWFARAGLTVTSGLATGIDAASHEGALQGGGATIAVFGTGLDQVYPGANRALTERIRTHGALVSEFPPGTAPLHKNFPQRNRIIAGLALGTLVVEAARRSGSLITARLAIEAGREVFAIPGSIHSPLSRGCHQLIKAGAKLVEEARDVTEELGFSVPEERLTQAARPLASDRELDKEYEMLLDALGFEPATIDSLVARTELPSESIASMLLILELEGRVAALPGGRFGRIP
ncbi:MAG TPA: DNA-processing protein DprA [Steroidobacteraceae bacterium]|nr:DNA-processing protein DprA [Steroidobacteraceae bacterium]